MRIKFNTGAINNIIAFFFFVVPMMAFAQEEAVTAGGKVVILYPDSTWKLKVLASAVDSTQHDSVTVVKPEKQHKLYSDTTTGFKGFLKPHFKIPTLPEDSEGMYEYRVKVNKGGFVKEVITTHRGPNGEAEMTLRNWILKLKFMPDGSVVPPLTEGSIKITVHPKTQ